MGGEKLTGTESNVLLELVRRQRESDKSIAERLGMAPSNFAVVKRRLIEKGVLLEQIRVNMQRVGQAQVAAFIWLEYNRAVRAALREKMSRIRSGMPVAYTFGTSDWSLNVDYFSSFEDAENSRLHLAEQLQDFAADISAYTWKTLPMSHLVTCTFMGRLVEHALMRQVSKAEMAPASTGGECELPESPGNIPSLNSTEKKVLVAMRRFPSLRKSEIAVKVGIKQSSLSEVFWQLQKKGVINYVRTIDPTKLPGLEVATFAWIDLTQPMLGEQGAKLMETLVDTTPQVFKLYYTKTFALMNCYFHSLEKAETSHLKLLEIFGDNIKSFNFKVVPCAHLSTEYTPYFLEQLFDVHFTPPGTPI